MNLSSEQIEAFRRDGYLVCPQLFSDDEISPFREMLPEVMARRGPQTYREIEDGKLARIVFALHMSDEPFRRLSLHPRVLKPVETLLGTQVHTLQTRVNYKSGFSPVSWTWHQDYNKWRVVDKLKEPRALLVGVFLDENTACNGPVMVIKGSHRFGHRPIPVQKVGLGQELITEMAEAGQVEALLGSPGTVVFLDALTVHGSSANMTPSTRAIFYAAYNSIENTPIDSPRDETRCGKDYRALIPLEDDCLLFCKQT